MIRSWRDDEARRLFSGTKSRRLPPDIQRTAKRKLAMLNAAITLGDLRVPPNNRLEKLGRDRAGQWRIRINSQWRVCFKWDGEAYDVEIADYHD